VVKVWGTPIDSSLVDFASATYDYFSIAMLTIYPVGRIGETKIFHSTKFEPLTLSMQTSGFLKTK